jgi:hypothetical protein
VVFKGRAAIGYDHGYDAEVFYLGLALDPKYVEGFVDGSLRGSARTTKKGRIYCGASGRRGIGRWCSRS